MAYEMPLGGGIHRISSDLGVGLSTLNKWITARRDTDVVSDKDLDLARENERLIVRRRGVGIPSHRCLQLERDTLFQELDAHLAGVWARGCAEKSINDRFVLLVASRRWIQL